MINVREFYEDLGLEVIKEAPEGKFSRLSHCPFCNKSGKSGVILSGKNKGAYNCFSGSCQTKGNFAYIYSLVKEIPYEEAEDKIYGKSRESSSRVNIEFVTEEESVSILPPPRTMNPYFKDIEESDFAWAYIENRGYKMPDDLEEIDLYKVNSSKAEFWEEIKDNTPNKTKGLIYNMRRSFQGSPPELSKVLDIFRDQFQEEEIQDAYFIIEASRLCGRVVIPAIMNGQYYGYVARATKSDMIPKTLNQAGGFTNFAIGNFDVVKNKDRVVINEGAFDSYSCGPEACYLYGKNISVGSKKIELLKLLSPKVTIIYLDVGAEEDSLRLHDELSFHHNKVCIVSPPEFIPSEESDSEARSRIINNGIGVVSSEFDRTGLRIPYRSWLALKMFKSFNSDHKKAKAFLKRMSRTSAFKNEVFVKYVAARGIFNDCYDDFCEFISKHDFIDAGDLYNYNSSIIDKTVNEFSVEEYVTTHGLER